MRKILMILMGSMIVLSFLFGCATSPLIQTEQVEGLKSVRISHLIIPVENRTIDAIYMIPSEFSMLENMIPEGAEDIYTQFIIVVWGGDTAYGLIFDKYDFRLVAAMGLGDKYLDHSYTAKAWIYPADKDGFPVECTVDEQDLWLLELDYQLSQQNRAKI